VVAIVGVGQVVQREPGGLDAVGLMVAAARLAAEDAGVPELLARLDAVLVPEGTWGPGDAGRDVAAALGSPGARTVLARVGVLQTALVAGAARFGVALVVGGEARASERAGWTAPAPVAPGPADEEWVPAGDIVTAIEIERGLAVPVQSYAVQQSAFGTDGLDALWDRFAAVAATNRYAWGPPADGDRVISTPYRRRHCSDWNVDMGVAVLVCSTAVADALGIPDERRVHPHVVAQCDDMVPLSQRPDLDRSPGLAGIARHVGEPDHLDLYSCFPSAVMIQARELGVPLERQLTVTGGMAFAGGPLNSAVLHALAAMTDVLRADPGATGLVTAVSGMLTKQGAVTLSTIPPAHGLRRVAVADPSRPVAVDAAYAGEAVVDGSTVVHDRGGPALAVVVATTPAGTRVVATGPPALAAEPGEVVSVGAGGLRARAASPRRRAPTTPTPPPS
jgi:acetyl-CoA C-acetyltransferase